MDTNLKLRLINKLHRAEILYGESHEALAQECAAMIRSLSQPEWADCRDILAELVNLLHEIDTDFDRDLLNAHLAETRDLVSHLKQLRALDLSDEIIFAPLAGTRGANQ